MQKNCKALFLSLNIIILINYKSKIATFTKKNMGLFGNKNEVKTSNSQVAWIALEDLGQLNEIKTVSDDKFVLIFKHSSGCIVSRMALKQFEKDYKNNNHTTNYFLDLLSFREISNAVASKFEVQHQSPQILIINNGKCVYKVSHDAIDAETIDGKTF